MATEATIVSRKEVSSEELENLLAMPGPDADNVMLAEQTKPSVFSRKKTDLSYLDKNEPVTSATTTAPAAQNGAAAQAPAAPAGKDIVEEVAPTPGEEDFDGTAKQGTPGTIAGVVKSLIKAGKLVPFDDDKPIDNYTEKDFEELLEANYAERDNKLRQEVPAQFFESLSDELKIAAKYEMDGGKDMKGLFRALAHAEEITSLDPTDPNDHEKIVRQFLATTGFGTQDEIDEEITGLKDRGELEKKAGQFKPKLDKMQEAIISQRLADQEQKQAQQAAQAKAYVGSVYKTLATGELGGTKTDRKTQELLYAGLIHPRYPSISGKPTNLLGHLLEKYQFVDPRHDLIAEALWLLADPDGYKSKLMERGKNGSVEKTVRMLRTEEANRTPASTIVEKEETTQKRIPKPTPNFFKR